MKSVRVAVIEFDGEVGESFRIDESQGIQINDSQIFTPIGLSRKGFPLSPTLGAQGVYCQDGGFRGFIVTFVEEGNGSAGEEANAQKKLFD